MVVYSTVGGFVSTRSASSGSGFIQAFCDSVRIPDVSKPTHHHMAKIIEETKFKLSNQYGSLSDRQLAEVTDTFRKHFYLALKGNILQ